jgi:predicted amidophosphoribosyltransferase
MFCSFCGAENPDNKTLCSRCRKPLAITRALRASQRAVALRLRGPRSACAAASAAALHQAAAPDEP